MNDEQVAAQATPPGRNAMPTDMLLSMIEADAEKIRRDKLLASAETLISPESAGYKKKDRKTERRRMQNASRRRNRK